MKKKAWNPFHLRGVQPSSRGMNWSEKEFLIWISERYPSLTALRQGWPDFLFPFKNSALAVEVKTIGAPKLSPTQLKMFNALDQIGVVGAVWCPSRPGLIAWLKWHKLFTNRASKTVYDPLMDIETLIRETAAELDKAPKAVKSGS